MSLPGFSAEHSMYRITGQYRTSAIFRANSAGWSRMTVQPAQDDIAPPAGPDALPPPPPPKCRLIDHWFSANECSTTGCKAPYQCKPTSYKLRAGAIYRLVNIPGYLLKPYDVEPDACGCVDTRPVLTTPRPGGEWEPEEGHEHQPHRPEDEESPQMRMTEEELERLRQGWELESELERFLQEREW